MTEEKVPPVGGATYDPEADALYVRLTDGEHGRTVDVHGDGTYLVHLDPAGAVYAVERLTVHRDAHEDAERDQRIRDTKADMAERAAAPVQHTVARRMAHLDSLSIPPKPEDPS